MNTISSGWSNAGLIIISWINEVIYNKSLTNHGKHLFILLFNLPVNNGKLTFITL